MTTVDEAAAVIDRGGLIVLPTDTVYGLAGKPEEATVDRLFAIKRRPAGRAVQLLVGESAWLERFGSASAAARALTDAFWPGPLTLVVRASPRAPRAVVHDGTIGLRVPGHPIALELLARVGPLAATSANISGEPTPPTIDGIRELFGDDVDAYLDGGAIGGRASTVVDLTDSTAVIVREGVVTKVHVTRVIARGRFEPG